MVELLYEWYGRGYYTLETTIINLVVGALMFGIAYYLVKKHYIDFNESFIKGMFAWSFFGLGVRLIADFYNIAMPYMLLFITPFIYVEVFVFSLLVYFVLKQNTFYWSLSALILAIIPFLIVFLGVQSFYFYYGAVIFIVVLMAFIFGYFVLFKKNEIFSMAFAFQVLDAISTFIAITFRGFYEEHVLGRAIIAFAESSAWVINGSGAWLFFVSKVLFIGGLLYYVYKADFSNTEKMLLVVAIGLLGLVVGLRNTFNVVFA